MFSRFQNKYFANVKPGDLFVGEGAPVGSREWRKCIFKSDRYTFEHLHNDPKLMQMYVKMMMDPKSGILQNGKVVLRHGERVPTSNYTRDAKCIYLPSGAGLVEID